MNPKDPPRTGHNHAGTSGEQPLEVDDVHRKEESGVPFPASHPVRSTRCEGCLVVRTGHGPQAEVAQVFGLELLVELGGRHLEGLEEEQRNGEEKETGEENNHHTTHKWTCMDGMTRARRLEPRCDMRCINEMRSVCSGLSVVHVHVRDGVYVDHRVVLKVVSDVAIICAVICS